MQKYLVVSEKFQFLSLCVLGAPTPQYSLYHTVCRVSISPLVDFIVATARQLCKQTNLIQRSSIVVCGRQPGAKIYKSNARGVHSEPLSPPPQSVNC